MESLKKYFFHGAIGLIFGQAIGLFISPLFMGSKLLPAFSLTAMWGIFGFYTGVLWNKGLKFGALGVAGGILAGILWYSQIIPSIEYAFIWIIPGILFALFLLASAVSERKINKTNICLSIGIALVVTLISIFPKYITAMENNFIGVIPPLIGLFSFIIPLMILGGLICIGFYYESGNSDMNKKDVKNIFLKLGMVISFIWILFMFVFALGSSHDPGYSISKVNETESYFIIEAGEINRFPYFAKAINDIEISGKEIYNSGAVPRGEWNALRDYIDQKRQSGGGGSYVKINDSFYEINFYTP